MHCGAGVSRSAALVAMFLMRSRRWPAQRALAAVKAARSAVGVNDGFYLTLCALEERIGVPPNERCAIALLCLAFVLGGGRGDGGGGGAAEHAHNKTQRHACDKHQHRPPLASTRYVRSDVTATTGFAGNDAPAAVRLAADAAGERVPVAVVDLNAVAQRQQQQQQQQRGGGGDDRRERRRSSRSRSRGRRDRERERERDRRRRSRSRSRSRSRDRDRDRRRRSRSRSRSRERSRHDRRRSRSRSRGRERERDGAAPSSGAPPAAAAAAAAVRQDPVAAAFAAALAAARAAGGKKGHWLLALTIDKPGEGRVGGLVLGPMGPHQRVVFGRAPPPAADVTLEHPSSSRRHAALAVDGGGGGGVTLTDLGSAHGTRVGDAWIKPDVARPVVVGAQFSFGASSRTFTLAHAERV